MEAALLTEEETTTVVEKKSFIYRIVHENSQTNISGVFSREILVGETIELVNNSSKRISVRIVDKQGDFLYTCRDEKNYDVLFCEVVTPQNNWGQIGVLMPDYLLGHLLNHRAS